MAIKIRPITPEESEILDRWQRSDDIVRYRRARILRLSEGNWRCPAIAEALGLRVETVRLTIKSFNEGGIPAITPRPRSGGRPARLSTPEVAETAEDLVRQAPPTEEGRATWTLQSLAEVIAARFDHISTMSYETVRRLLSQRKVVYRQAKEWLTSPDPLYALRKSQRDRLLAMARAAPDGAAVWLDQSWFVRWPYRFRTWAPKDEPLRVAKRWNEEVDTTALYATLDDETQEAFLQWAEGQPNSEVGSVPGGIDGLLDGERQAVYRPLLGQSLLAHLETDPELDSRLQPAGQAERADPSDRLPTAHPQSVADALGTHFRLDQASDPGQPPV